MDMTNMLSGTKTGSKNFSSNVLIRPLELTSEAIGSVAIDRIDRQTDGKPDDGRSLSTRNGRQAGKQALPGMKSQTR